MAETKMTEGDLINLKASCVKFVIDGEMAYSRNEGNAPAENVVKAATKIYEFLTGDLGKIDAVS